MDPEVIVGLVILAVIFVGVYLWDWRYAVRPCPACGRRWRVLERTSAPVKHSEGGKLEREYRCKHCGETTWLQDLSTIGFSQGP